VRHGPSQEGGLRDRRDMRVARRPHGQGEQELYGVGTTERRSWLSDDQAREFTCAYTSCKDGPTHIRYQAVRLCGTGYRVQEVMGITGCSRTSVMGWCRGFR
jgi:hypothetical protein